MTPRRRQRRNHSRKIGERRRNFRTLQEKLEILQDACNFSKRIWSTYSFDQSLGED